MTWGKHAYERDKEDEIRGNKGLVQGLKHVRFDAANHAKLIQSAEHVQLCATLANIKYNAVLTSLLLRR